jgi:hypothetical protein
MTAPEAAEAAAHLRECAVCSQQVHQFSLTHALLKTSPDVEPPRQIVFEAEKKASAAWWVWRWLAPAGSAVAASIITVLLMAPPAAVSAHSDEIQRLRSELAYWESQQRATQREMMDNARTLQMLAQRLPNGD